MLIAVCVILLGLYESLKYKKSVATLEEIMDFLNMLKNEINYRQSDYFNLYSSGQKSNYKYICFENGKILLSVQENKNIEDEFNHFINKIGTTDTEGQLSICQEYIRYFDDLYRSYKEKEMSKIRTNLSLSLFGALSIIIVFL